MQENERERERRLALWKKLSATQKQALAVVGQADFQRHKLGSLTFVREEGLWQTDEQSTGTRQPLVAKMELNFCSKERGITSEGEGERSRTGMRILRHKISCKKKKD